MKYCSVCEGLSGGRKVSPEVVPLLFCLSYFIHIGGYYIILEAE
jgi:hypothetical protein